MTRSGVYLEYGAGRGGYARAERIDFDGVLSVTHSHSLQTAEEERYGSAAAFVSNTRTLPETLLLEVILSSAQPGAADADSRLQALMRLRAERTLCRVHTPAREYADMLLTDLTVTRDASCPCGWSGALTFTCAAPPGANALARDSRGSVCVCGGEAYALPADAETVRRLLTAAGASPAETGAAAEGGALLLPLDPRGKAAAVHAGPEARRQARAPADRPAVPVRAGPLVYPLYGRGYGDAAHARDPADRRRGERPAGAVRASVPRRGARKTVHRAGRRDRRGRGSRGAYPRRVCRAVDGVRGGNGYGNACQNADRLRGRRTGRGRLPRAPAGAGAAHAAARAGYADAARPAGKRIRRIARGP